MHLSQLIIFKYLAFKVNHSWFDITILFASNKQFNLDSVTVSLFVLQIRLEK